MGWQRHNTLHIDSGVGPDVVQAAVESILGAFWFCVVSVVEEAGDILEVRA